MPRETNNKTGYRVCWYLQPPCEAFEVEVEDAHEAAKIMRTLAEYDTFQFENKIKPTYPNVGYYQEWDDEDKSWSTWHSSDGEDIDWLMKNGDL